MLRTALHALLLAASLATTTATLITNETAVASGKTFDYVRDYHSSLLRDGWLGNDETDERDRR